MHNTRETLKEERKYRAYAINLYYAFLFVHTTCFYLFSFLATKLTSARFLTAIKIGYLFILFLFHLSSGYREEVIMKRCIN